MADILKYELTQLNVENVPKRSLLNYYDDASPEVPKSLTIVYDDLSVEDKATFDSYIAMLESKMV